MNLQDMPSVLVDSYIDEVVKKNEKSEMNDNISSGIYLSNVSTDSLIKDFQLKEINVNISLGEKVLILGKNGSGKSTFLDLISGRHSILTKNYYVMNILGYNYSDDNAWYEINKNLLFLSRFKVRWHSTILENLIFAANGNRQLIDSVLENYLDLGKYANYRWNELSDGYKTRCLIAYGLIKFPKLLIFDEPFGPLDENSFEQTLELISKDKYSHITMIFTSQRPSLIENIIDKFLVFEDGKCMTYDKTFLEKLSKKVLKVYTKSQFDEKIFISSKMFDIKINKINSIFYLIEYKKSIDKLKIIDILIKNNIDILEIKDISKSIENILI